MADVKTLVLYLMFPPTIITAPTSEIALPKPVIRAEIIEFSISSKSCLKIFNFFKKFFFKVFGFSKAAYKRAIGRLYKDKHIKIYPKKIELLER